MFLDQYCTELENSQFSFTRQQSSDFAKNIANDFNPLHDVDTKKFCVPGDLLFARILSSEGLYPNMRVTFSGMVSDGVALTIHDADNGDKILCDQNEKEYLRVEHSGEQSNNADLIAKLVKTYVAFSGENFPHVLVPLMKEKNVMINVARPLVIYETMSVHLETVDLKDPVIEASQSHLEVNGKRGNVTLGFIFKDGGKVVGEGKKTMVLANLREYDQPTIDALVDEYNRRRIEHAA
ncbi:DUF3581 family protein [Endozoicomonas arenosclerae]|uniref:DUF3581 family protein n=1 Tax=Endozoicomonas arenosclerae TaxID=1633495 RepID=UPI00078049FB|nr:DUF3581 family protein [Endozoicomonas arenosclerae]